MRLPLLNQVTEQLPPWCRVNLQKFWPMHALPLRTRKLILYSKQSVTETYHNTHYLSNILFNIIFPMTVIHNRFISLRFCGSIFVCITYVSHACYIPVHSLLLEYITLTNLAKSIDCKAAYYEISSNHLILLYFQVQNLFLG